MNRLTLCRSLALSVLLLALVGSPLLAGVVFEVETTYHSDSRRGPESAQMFVEGKNLKMVILPRQGGSNKAKDEAIFRGDRRQMVVVDHDRQDYMVIDSQSVAQFGGQVQGQMQQAMKEVEKRLAQLDPKQREMAEKMLKGGLGVATGQEVASAGDAGHSPSEYRRTSERATQRGYPCEKVEVLRDGQKVRELWVTDWSNVKGGRDVADAFKEMEAFFEEIIDSVSGAMGGMGGMGDFFDAGGPIESYSKIGGFPVITRSFEGGELESEAVLESTTARELDPAAFEPPKGYRLRTMGPQ